MASKSRLGKGLGALFPTLPGDPNQTAQASDAQKAATKNTADNAATRNGVSRETPEMKHVSRETPHDVSSDSAGQQEHVSRETSHKAGGQSQRGSREPQQSSGHTKKRMSIPSLQTMAHPSDLFFGGSDDAQTAERRQAGASSSASNHTKDMRRMTQVITDAVQTLGQHESAMTAGHAEAKADASSSSSMVGTERGIDVSRETSIEPTPETEDGAGKEQESEELKPVQGGYLAELKLSDIGPNKEQPRTIFDEDELRELADSIREVGVLQPIVVRKRPVEQIKASRHDADSSEHSNTPTELHPLALHMDSPYELIMGERRWRASQLAGLETIPAIVKTTSDNHMLRDALLENLHRVALNPLEEAAAYQQMIDEFGLTQAQLSTSVSKSRPQIANTLRLLNLPAAVQKKVAAGVLSAGHARALLGLGSEEEMEQLANRIIAEGLSVRSTEEIVAMKTVEGDQAKQEKAKAPNPWKDSPIRQNLEQHFDTKVSIKGNQKHGRIEISFSSPDDMQRILDLLMPGQNKTADQTSESSWV